MPDLELQTYQNTYNDENMRKLKNTTKTPIAADPLLVTVYISDLVPYSEYDHACNGGYFICPHCGNQEYVSESEHGKIDECSRCSKPFMFNG